MLVGDPLRHQGLEVLPNHFALLVKAPQVQHLRVDRQNLPDGVSRDDGVGRSVRHCADDFALRLHVLYLCQVFDEAHVRRLQRVFDFLHADLAREKRPVKLACLRLSRRTDDVLDARGAVRRQVVIVHGGDREGHQHLDVLAEHRPFCAAKHLLGSDGEAENATHLVDIQNGKRRQVRNRVRHFELLLQQFRVRDVTDVPDIDGRRHIDLLDLRLQGERLAAAPLADRTAHAADHPFDAGGEVVRQVFVVVRCDVVWHQHFHVLTHKRALFRFVVPLEDGLADRVRVKDGADSIDDDDAVDIHVPNLGVAACHTLKMQVVPHAADYTQKDVFVRALELPHGDFAREYLSALASRGDHPTFIDDTLDSGPPVVRQIFVVVACVFVWHQYVDVRTSELQRGVAKLLLHRLRG
eukprot:Rhum_TRINITY_DN14006_c0_g1::Rhum_TRINITY_DN14006_c0_g1_i1::g.67306::m.67306